MTISEPTSRRLLLDSAGFCANPACGTEIFVPLPNGSVATVYERAHVIGRSRSGPRGEVESSPDERDSYDNLLLLCGNCHMVVDQHPNQFPAETLLEWKASHRARTRLLFEVPRYETRADLANHVRPLLDQNSAAHDAYGPRDDPSDFDTPSLWQDAVLRTIIPNNRSISEVLRANEGLLSEAERATLHKFDLHREGLEYNYFSGNKNSAVPLFPPEMSGILDDVKLEGSDG